MPNGVNVIYPVRYDRKQCVSFRFSAQNRAKTTPSVPTERTPHRQLITNKGTVMVERENSQDSVDDSGGEGSPRKYLHLFYTPSMLLNFGCALFLAENKPYVNVCVCVCVCQSIL